MTTRLKELLEWYAAGPHFNGKGDHERDGSWYYHAMLECLFPLIEEAAVQDGVSAETVMKFLVRAAFEVMKDPRAETPTQIPDQPPQPSQRPFGKRSDPAWSPVTILMRKSVKRAVRRRLEDEEQGRGLSTLVDSLLNDWLARQG